MDSVLEKNKFLLDNLEEGVYFVDVYRKITYWNSAAEKITGFSSKEVIGKFCWDNILKHIDSCGKELCKEGCPLQSTCQDGKMRKVDIFLHHKDGHRVPVTVKAIPIMDESFVIRGAIEIFTSNADEEYFAKIKELEKIAMTDTLTGIANRLYTDKYINEKVEIFKVNERSFGVAFVDIDHFKSINDKYGHDIGDIVLKTVTNTISNNLRNTDLIGRWGGEEFVVYIEKVNGENIFTILDKLRILIENSEINTGKEIIKVTASIGGVVIKSGNTKDEIIKNADKLMYESKNNGRNRVTV